MNAPLDKKTAAPSEEKQLEGLAAKVWHSVTSNWPWKLLALGLAIIMWAGLISQDASLVREKIFTDVAVTITGAETLQRNGYIVVNDLKTNPITVRMEVDVPQLSYNSVGATYYNPRLDLSKITAAGPQTLKITTTSTSTYGTVTELTPDTVQVEVEEYITRYRIPVTIEQKGEIPEGYYLDDLKLDPSLVAVSGPKSLVNQVRRAVAELDLSQLAPKEGGYAEAIPFKLLDAQGEEIVSDLISVTSESVLLDSVVVEYDLYPLQQISLSTLGLTKGEPAEGYEVKSVAVTPSIIQAAGPAEVLELLDLKALFLEQTVSLEDRTESFNAQVRVRRPSNIVSLTPESVTLSVEIGPVITDKSFSNLKISLQNVPDGFNAKASDTRGDVTLTGPKLWLDKLKSSALSLSCDLSGLEAEGEHQVEILCEVKGSDGISYMYSVEPANVQITLNAK